MKKTIEITFVLDNYEGEYYTSSFLSDLMYLLESKWEADLALGDKQLIILTTPQSNDVKEIE